MDGSWLTVPVTGGEDTYTAHLDDEHLPDGVYEVRAHAVDAAGNERTTNLDAAGRPVELALPLRVQTALKTGRLAETGRKGHRVTRFVDRRSLTVPFGQPGHVHGRLLTAGDNGVAGGQIEVWQRPDDADSSWVRVSVVQTDAAGGFEYTAPAGRSRQLRFRYPGTPTVKPSEGALHLGVKAATTFRASPSSVVNGEYVTFHGKLGARPVAPEGKLVQLQVRSRNRWATFGTPRANAATGKWSFPYRFSATRGDVRYRFRVVVPRESGYPYETGVSRTIAVRVRGL